MNTSTKRRIGAGVAAVITAGLLIASPTPVGATSLQASRTCLAIDTVPLCELRVPADAHDAPGDDSVNPSEGTSDWEDDIGFGCTRPPRLVIAACPE